MRHYLKYISITVLLAFIASCQDEPSKYPEDVSVSNTNGQPLDSFQFYFPHKIIVGDSEIESAMDTFGLKWYSATLFAFNEPMLFNYYQGHDIYRFLWLRSFDAPIVISLHKNDDEVWLTVKKLDRQPKFIDMYEPDTISYDPDDTVQISTEQTHHLIKADRVANIVLDEKKMLSEAEWDKFDSLLSACQFRTMTPSISSHGIDGSQWIIEAHLRDGYYFVERWSPQDNFQECGKYLIELSGLQDYVY